MQLGACFVVGPLFNPEVAKVCNRRQVPYIPGCGTVSEVGAAQEAGCEICKGWLSAGADYVGMGSKLFPKDKVAAGDWQYVTDKCREALSYVAK